jgi:nucleoside-diphosphate kinase
VERTLLIIKPDAVRRKLIGYVIERLLRAGFDIVEMRMERLSTEKAREFYAVHEGKPFLDSLVEFMASDRIVAVMLEKKGAVSDLRKLIGATNPDNADCGTLRQEIALNVQENSVHASDSVRNAETELNFFFG